MSIMGMTGGDNLFLDPFDDPISQKMPKTVQAMIQLSRALYYHDPTYRSGIQRVATYFLTEIEYKSISKGEKRSTDEDRDKIEVYARDELKIYDHLGQIAIDFLVTNNSFVSLLTPFRRYLTCPRCGTSYPFDVATSNSALNYRFKNYGFMLKCQNPRCGFDGEWACVDRVDRNGEFTIKRWPPQEITIHEDMFSHACQYRWRVPETYRRQVKDGDTFILKGIRKEILETIANSADMILERDMIFHLKMPTLAGTYTGGWGLGGAILSLRQIYHRQNLLRMNNSIADYHIMPFEWLCPQSRAGASDAASSDPMVGLSGGNWQRTVSRQLKEHRASPGPMKLMPVPLEYGKAGGDANQLAPTDLMDRADDVFLNGLNIPSEFYRMSLTIQATPMFARFFEATWAHLPTQLNAVLRFLIDQLTKSMGWEPVEAVLKKPAYADDATRQMALLQLMMNKNISQTTAMRALGLDFEQEQMNLLEEQTFVNDKTTEIQEDEKAKQEQQGFAAQAQQQFPAQPSQGGPPQGGSGGGQPQGASSIQEIQQKADEIADHLNTTPDTQRKSELIALKQQDSTLHALVTSKLDAMRRQENTAGGAMLRGQQQQQAQGQGQPGQ